MNFLWEKPFEFLVSTVGQYVVETWRQKSHIDSHLDNLHDTLSRGHELIRRSECWRLPKYKPIDELLPLLKDAVYEAESIIDELEYQRLKQKVQKSWPGEFLTDYFKNWMSGFPKRVKENQENLSKFCNKMERTCNKLQIPEDHNQFSETARPITTRFGDTCTVYGRDKELNDVIHLLGVSRSGSGSRGKKRTRKHNMSTLAVGESSSSVEKGNVSIISIVGLGGVGKTTLAQMVYNDRNVKCYFEKLVWVCISEDFDVKRLTKEIIEYTTKKSCDHTTLSRLQETLEETLKSTRFLLVLDDAWSENEMDWQQLLGPMRGGIEGSAILVTTRSQKVAKVAGNGMNSMGSIYLEGLEESIYWEFFKSCAFGSEARTPELEEIGKQICKKLKGSPLAAKTIGGLLKINLDVSHWSIIRESKMWKLEQKEHHILPVLQLSYQYLPSYLKKCFSFCSLYPKDHKFKKTELFKFWMMHGFINSQENSQQARDVLAGVYFDQLVGRCFFQKAAGSRSEEYVIHDLMHDVCQSITKDECFCLGDEDLEKEVSLDIRHLSVFRKELNQDKQNELIKYKKLLSLSIVFPSSCCTTTIENWCNNLTSIRSLSLINCNLRKLPESIGNLKHLQYLDISYSKIRELPNSFCNLYNLKYLNMEGKSVCCSFPEGSDKLVGMQIFYFPSVGMRLEGSVMNLANIIIVKDLQLSLPKGGRTNVKIQNLKHITITGSLTIEDLDFVPSKEAAEEAELNKKPLINILNLVWSYDQSLSNEHHDEEVLEGLCPHPNLKGLTIRYYGGRNLSPTWLREEFLPNLMEFGVYSCVNDFIISHLPRCITKLDISCCVRLTNLENCLRPDHLPALKYLAVWCCEELISLPVESFGGFLSLEQLKIYNCPKLTCPNAMVLPSSLKNLFLDSCGDLEKSIPSCLQNLTSLDDLSLRKCPRLVSIPAEVTSSLESLSSLLVLDCAELQSLGGLQFLASLQRLYIQRCPKLEETGGQDVYERLPSELLRNFPSSSDGRRKRRAREARN